MVKINAILFDLDNTLIDFMRMKKLSIDAAVYAMIDAGLDMNLEKAKKEIYEVYKEKGMEYKQVFQKFMKKTIRKVDYRILAHGINAYNKTQLGAMQPYPRVRSTLTELARAGFILGVVSDAPKIKAWMRMADMSIDHFFDVVVTFDDTKKRKPAKEPFLKAIKKLKMKPEEILFIGDMPDKDIKGAKNVGMVTCIAKYGQIKKSNEKADYSVKFISELPELIKKIK